MARQVSVAPCPEWRPDRRRRGWSGHLPEPRRRRGPRLRARAGRVRVPGHLDSAWLPGSRGVAVATVRQRQRRRPRP